MALPGHIPRLIKFSPLAFLVLTGLLMAGSASAASFPASDSSLKPPAPPGEVKMTLSGPRQVVVRNLPPHRR